MTTISEIYQICVDFWYKNGDPRAQNFLFLRTPIPIIVTILAYIVICKIILPKCFKDVKYPCARYFLVGTYIIQLGNCILAFYGLYLMIITHFNPRCEPITPEFDGLHYELAVVVYIWLCIKNFEMVESFLVYFLYGVVPNFIFIHHILLPLFLTILIHFYMGGSPIMFGTIHSIDHSFNYIFIALRMYSDEYRRKSETWFKKYQFLSSILSMIACLIFFLQLEKRDDCDYEFFKYVSSTILFIFLFLTIYYRAANLINHRKKSLCKKEEHYMKVSKTAMMFDPT
ncbi:hypothetical protein PVAND_012382 [Polypedilum vanderplanki]|uniref:Very-long-chain 3-oxoacyl-CoA synthase n=1 Tax=Polypedilum vanderplanki TaxID=319348 RepID=A0A9J6CM90_POLVA|nr:hypothetical protein PVAND_012382 [Polypedilum vanderplanki]